MRAVGFRRQWGSFDVALRYRFAKSLEHLQSFHRQGFLRLKSKSNIHKKPPL
jgi:hypothetical protein